MEKQEIIELSNEFFKKAKLMDPLIKKIVITFEGDEDQDNINVKNALKSAEFVFGGCRYIPGLGVICF